MAKKSLIAKAKRAPKFKVRAYTAARSVAGPMVICVSSDFAVSVSANWHLKAKYLAL